MTEQVKVEVIEITRVAQSKVFQIKVPMNATKIIGIETGARLISTDLELSIPVVASALLTLATRLPVFGCLTLQSCEKPNVFYSGLIMDDVLKPDDNTPPAIVLTELPWTHAKKIQEDILISPQTTIIQGCYRDYFGASLNTHAHYKVFLAIWFEVEEAKKGKA
jgi:hypothetical protein